MTVMGSITSRYLPRTKRSRSTLSAMFQMKLDMVASWLSCKVPSSLCLVPYLNQFLIVWATIRPFSTTVPVTPSATLLASPIHLRIGVALLTSLVAPSRFLLISFTFSAVSGRLRSPQQGCGWPPPCFQVSPDGWDYSEYSEDQC